MNDYEIFQVNELIQSIKHDTKHLTEMPIYKEHMPQADVAYIKLKEAVLWLEDIDPNDV